MNQRWSRVLAGAFFLPLTLGAQQVGADTKWKTHLAYLSTGSGVWVASNEQYRTADNGEPRSYAQRYWLGFGRTTLHGCLWGEYEAQRPVFWRFFTAWDPAMRQFIVHQESGNGTIGLGTESLGTGIAEQLFTRPDGESTRQRHTSEKRGADTLVTRSFELADGDWQARRVYTWVKQPAGTPAGC
jgi:hypothetical protein